MGTHTKNIDLRKFLCLFLKTDTEDLFLMSDGTVFQSVGAANVLKLKWGIERRFVMINVADEMEWYCCGLILLHYLQDRVIMIGKSFKIL